MTWKRMLSTAYPCRLGLAHKPLKYSTDLVSVEVVSRNPLAKDPFPSCQKEIQVKGPRGKLSFPIFPYMKLDMDYKQENDSQSNKRAILVQVEDPADKYQRMMQGTTRAFISNMIKGVTEGFVVVVRLVGIGYRAELVPSKDDEPSYISLRLGFSHPVNIQVPEGIQVSLPSPQRILLTGNDKQQVTQLSARIRSYRPPEPYNQKGIFVNDETIKKKEGKKR